jgi:hypothetical protein
MIERFIAWLKELAAALEAQGPAPRGRVSLVPPGRAEPKATVGLQIYKAKEGRWYSEQEARTAGIMEDKDTIVTVESHNG